MANLDGKRIACVATDGFEFSELVEPKKAFEEVGAQVDVVSVHEGNIQGETKGERAGSVPVDATVETADPEMYDALLLPGGVANPDRLRLSSAALSFIRHFVTTDKPVAAICHGPWTLINTGGVQAKRVTSWPSLQVDLENAGAEWVDAEVVRDDQLVTSRNPGDIPAFCREAIALFESAP